VWAVSQHMSSPWPRWSGSARAPVFRSATAATLPNRLRRAAWPS